MLTVAVDLTTLRCNESESMFTDEIQTMITVHSVSTMAEQCITALGEHFIQHSQLLLTL